MKKKNSTVLYLAKVPPDPEGQLAVILAMFRDLTGREPTAEEIEDARNELNREEPSHQEGRAAAPGLERREDGQPGRPRPRRR